MARHYASKAHASIIHNSEEHRANKKALGRSNSAFTIPEDESAVAMMPQNVVYRSVSSPYNSLPEEYEDEIEEPLYRSSLNNPQLDKSDVLPSEENNTPILKYYQ